MKTLGLFVFYVCPYLLGLVLIVYPKKVQKFFAWWAGLLPSWLQGPFSPRFYMWEGWAIWFRVQGVVLVLGALYFHLVVFRVH